MVTALCRVHEAKCSGTAHNSATNSESAQFECTQTMLVVFSRKAINPSALPFRLALHIVSTSIN
jgi:hypothetical protein